MLLQVMHSQESRLSKSTGGCRLEPCSQTASCRDIASIPSPPAPPTIQRTPGSRTAGQTPPPSLLPFPTSLSPPDMESAPSPANPPPTLSGQQGSLCGSRALVQVPQELYNAVQASPACARLEGPTTCTVLGYVVDFELYARIKAGACLQVITRCLVLYSPGSSSL